MAGGVFSTALHGAGAARAGQVRRPFSPISGAELRDTGASHTGAPHTSPEQV